jgi:hypothetical protein
LCSLRSPLAARRYRTCIDRSPARLDTGQFSVVRIDSSTSHEWGTTETRQTFERFHHRLINENRKRDKCVRSSVDMRLDGIVGKQLLFVGGEGGR